MLLIIDERHSIERVSEGRVEGSGKESGPGRGQAKGGADADPSVIEPPSIGASTKAYLERLRQYNRTTWKESTLRYYSYKYPDTVILIAHT